LIVSNRISVLSSGYLSDGGVHNLAHIVGVLGEIQSVSSFASQTHAIHGAEDTLVSAVRMKSGAIGTINFTFVSSQSIFIKCSVMIMGL
jgi:UDP-N-acetyl-2-amino-2-deoxyglucuronate dehydrogenase